MSSKINNENSGQSVSQLRAMTVARGPILSGTQNQRHPCNATEDNATLSKTSSLCRRIQSPSTTSSYS